MLKGAVLLGTLALGALVPARSRAQSLIVRLDPSAPTSLRAGAGAGKATEAATAALFAGVVGSRAVAESSPALDGAFVLDVATEADRDALVARWAATPGVRYAEPNRTRTLDRARMVAPSRPADDVPAAVYDSLRHLAVVGARAAHRVTRGAPTVRVGFVDSGLYFAHPAFAGRVWVNPGEDLNGNGVADAADFNGRDDDGNGYADDLRGYDFVDRPRSTDTGDYRLRDPDPSDDNVPGAGRGHGTLVAGVVGAQYLGDSTALGVAPDVRLVPLRAFGADGTGEDDDIAAAIVYAADAGLDVLNLSFGDVYPSLLMEEAIAYAVARGVTVVASGGNDGSDRPHYPSDFADVVSVAWLTEDGTGRAGRASYGVGIDLGAPASATRTTLLPSPSRAANPARRDLYGFAAGSSLAAPLVAGAAALLRSLDPTLTPGAIRAVLTATADDLGEPGWDHQTGAGRLRVDRALARALPARVELTSPVADGGANAARVPVVGTTLDPSFVSYSVDVAEGDTGAFVWRTLAADVTTPRVRDTLAVWNTAGFRDTLYTLRLAVRRREGGTVEERRRVYLDRTAPALTPGYVGLAWQDGAPVLAAELATDDETTADLRLLAGADSVIGRSDRRARLHGLTAALPPGFAGRVRGVLRATNTAGLVRTAPVDVVVPADRRDPALLAAVPTGAPAGVPTPRLTDFDHDGAPDLALNVYAGGQPSDTLAFYEWDGAALRRRDALPEAPVLPLDGGDPDRDGRADLLVQYGGYAYLLESPSATTFPTTLSFADSTRYGGAGGPNAYPALLADLDGDGRGEIVVHSTNEWRVVEWDGQRSYALVATLPNPTPVGTGEVRANRFGASRALTGDFDGDGRPELLVLDEDGDLIAYEATGDNQYRAVWTDLSDRYAARPAFVAGDFDGDGRRDFGVVRTTFESTRSDRQQEPPLAFATLYRRRADDAFDRWAEVAFTPASVTFTALAGVDLDDDGRDELVATVGPNLYAFAFDGDGTPRLRYHRGAAHVEAPTGPRATALVTGDLDRDGRTDLLVPDAAGALVWYRRAGDPLNPAPAFFDARPLDARTVVVRVRTAGADSLVVYRDALRIGATAGADSLTVRDTPGGPARYRAYAVRGGHRSLPTAEILARPHAPVVLADAAAVGADRVRLTFTGPLRPPPPEVFDVGGATPLAVLPAEDGRGVLLALAAPLVGPTAVRWRGLTDAEGTPVRDSSTVVAPQAVAATFFVTGADVLARDRVRIRFSEPLAPGVTVDRFEVRPAGAVAAVAFDPSRPDEVVVTLRGAVAGATGLPTALVARGLVAASGRALDPDGGAVRLTQAAADLSGVYVFPNPVRVEQHPDGAMLAGLPAEADAVVLAPDGRLVRRLTERDGDGGVRWDLADAAGAPVPSGVYLVRVTAPSARPALVKVAVFR